MSIAEKLTTIAKNVQKVYKAGYTAGQAAGGGGSYDAGYADGQQAKYDETWDARQKNGTATDYTFGFAGVTWNKDNFYPKYDITIKNGHSVFYYNQFEGSLKARLEEQGVKLIFQQTDPLTSVFTRASKITELPELDFSTCKATKPESMFSNCTKLQKIERLILPATFVSYSAWFTNCTALENLTVDGVIAGNMILSDCTKLTHDSLMSVINSLADVTAIWTKTDTIYEPVSEEFYTGAVVNGAEYYGRCFTTTNEEVYFYYDGLTEENEVRQGYLCVVDGVYYICNPTTNTNTYKLTLGATNLEKLTYAEKSVATEKGWTLV